MTELERECGVFCRALVGVDAPPALRAAYVRAHDVGAVFGAAPIAASSAAGAPTPPSSSAPPFDRWLVRFAAASPARTRFADSYAVIFARGSLLRRKLVLALALLESHAATSRLADSPRPGAAPAFYARAAFAAALFVLRAALAALVLSPVQLFLLAVRRP